MVDLVKVPIDRAQLVKWLGDESELLQGPQLPALRRTLEQAVAEALTLARPAYLYQLFPVNKVRHKQIVLPGGSIDSAWFAAMMAPARSIVLAVCTIGPALEERARAYLSERDAPRGYFLDAIGTGLVEITRCAAIARIEEMAAQQGDELSLPVSPGDTPWPLAQQQRIFDLLPAEQLGVTLSPNMVMRPLKSTSFAVGLGPDMGAAAEGSACDYCDIRERCKLRPARERQGK